MANGAKGKNLVDIRAENFSFLAKIQDFRLRLSGFVTGNFFIWASLAIYHYSAYYSGFLSGWTQKTLLYLAIIYSLYSLFFYAAASPQKIKNTTSQLTLAALKKLIFGILKFLRFGPKDYTVKLVDLKAEEKRALLFGVVKFYFIPIMLNFLHANVTGFNSSWNNLDGAANLFTTDGFNNLLYPMLFSLFLLVDTAFFAFGYLFEASFLSNKIRSVEPTALGWIVALICYPPFNSFMTGYAPWYTNDFPYLSSPTVTFYVRLGILVFMGIYAAASVALGPKASNLTNRGIVAYGPYAIVRHPAYICKNLAWWLGLLPILSIPAAISMAVWSGIYFLRAITEERHLAADPDYIKYCQKVKYRFIPGVI